VPHDDTDPAYSDLVPRYLPDGDPELKATLEKWLSEISDAGRTSRMMKR
jgi:hypothetical protein